MDKVIKNFNLDFSDIPATGENRQFTIVGDSGAVFNLEVKKSNGYYYNFTTKTFQEASTGLKNKIIRNGIFTGTISFPSVSSSDEVNGDFSSGATDIVMNNLVANTMAVGDRVTGNAALDQANITVTALDPDDNNTREFELSSSTAIDDDTILTFERDDQYDINLLAGPETKHAAYQRVNFSDGSVDINSSKGSDSLILQKVIYQYRSVSLIMSTYNPTGSFSVAPQVHDSLTIPRGKKSGIIPFSVSCTAPNIKAFKIKKRITSSDIMAFVEPTVGSDPENLPGEDIYPTVTTAANAALGGGTTVNGASTGTTVTTHVASATIATVGDRVLGNDALAAAIVTVETVSGGNTFTISEAVSIRDDLALSFSNRMNYQWPMDNIDKLSAGMVVLQGGNVTAGTMLGSYKDTIKINEGTDLERVITKNKAPASNKKGLKPTIVKGLVTAQEGNIIFNKQQVLALGGDTLKIGGYGVDQISKVYGYDVLFSDLKVSLGTVTTTTTSAAVSATSFNIASGNGVLINTSTISGPGIDASRGNPLVTAITNVGGATWDNSGAATITVNTPQTLQSGVTLTFAGAGKVANITGNIQVTKAGAANQTLRFDVEKLLTST